MNDSLGILWAAILLAVALATLRNLLLARRGRPTGGGGFIVAVAAISFMVAILVHYW